MTRYQLSGLYYIADSEYTQRCMLVIIATLKGGNGRPIGKWRYQLQDTFHTSITRGEPPG
jgi:hypothetical protein